MMQDDRKWCSPKESSVVDKKLVQLCHIFMQDMKKLMQGDKNVVLDGIIYIHCNLIAKKPGEKEAVSKVKKNFS